MGVYIIAYDDIVELGLAGAMAEFGSYSHLAFYTSYTSTFVQSWFWDVYGIHFGLRPDGVFGAC